MSKMIRLSTAVVAGLLFTGVVSVTHADVKIGFVDPVALIQNAPQSEAALKLLEQEFRPRNDDTSYPGPDPPQPETPYSPTLYH